MSIEQPRPANSGQETKQMPRSCEGGDKPHPYLDVCCKCLIIGGLHRNYVWLVVFVTIDNAEMFVLFGIPPKRNNSTFIAIACRQYYKKKSALSPITTFPLWESAY